jgi:glycosyltransferase involved in cell wall biosynthesis
MPRYWTINGRFLTQAITGVQRYGHEIVNALDDLLTEGHPLGDQLELNLLAPLSDFTMPQLKSIETRRAGSLTGHFWEQLTLPFHARGGILSLCNSSTILQRRQIVCIHDVNTILVPESYSPVFCALYRTAMPIIGRRALIVTTVSNYSAVQINKLGWATESKLRVIPDGYEHVRRWAPRHSSVTKAVAGINTIVVLGSPAPHKNISIVLRSAQELASHGLKIAVVGKLDPQVYRTAKLAQRSKEVIWLGRISDNELAALLKDSLCLAFPSLAEGFGLPPLEAMALGCPVVVSDRASLPEVCGEGALYASPNDSQEWIKCFLTLRHDQRLRDRQIEKGFARVKHYQWRTSAQRYLQAMAYVDGVATTTSTRAFST